MYFTLSVHVHVLYSNSTTYIVLYYMYYMHYIIQILDPDPWYLMYNVHVQCTLYYIIQILDPWCTLLSVYMYMYCTVTVLHVLYSTTYIVLYYMYYMHYIIQILDPDPWYLMYMYNVHVLHNPDPWYLMYMYNVHVLHNPDPWSLMYFTVSVHVHVLYSNSTTCIVQYYMYCTVLHIRSTCHCPRNFIWSKHRWKLSTVLRAYGVQIILYFAPVCVLYT